MNKNDKGARIMGIEEKEALIIIAKQIIAMGDKKASEVKLPEVDAIRLNLMNIIFKTNAMGRLFLDLSTSLYAQALMEGKTKILMDGIVKLGEIIFDVPVDENLKRSPNESP